MSEWQPARVLKPAWKLTTIESFSFCAIPEIVACVFAYQCRSRCFDAKEGSWLVPGKLQAADY